MTSKVRACVRTFVIAALLTVPLLAFGQDLTNQLNIGFPTNGIFSGSSFDSVQLNNGNLHIEIPLWSVPGRGLNVGYKYVYDNKGWYFDEHCNRITGDCTDYTKIETGSHMAWALVSTWGASFKETTASQTCSGGIKTLAYSYTMQEADGTKHHFVPDPEDPNGTCFTVLGYALYADDGSGWRLFVDSNTGAVQYAVNQKGTRVPGVVGGASVEDANGNDIIDNGNGTFTDTAGRIYSTPGTSYTDSSGTLQTIQVTTQTLNIQTDNCGGDGNTCYEYAGTWAAVHQITLPGGNLTYTINYPTTAGEGEPISITLPTGGQISWTWGPGASGGHTVASRTETAGGQSYTWTYGYGLGDLDPAGNKTVPTCTILNVGNGPNDPPCYITQMQYYQGSSTLLKTVVTDYEASSTAYGNNGYLPIRETTTWNQQNLVTKTETDWDSVTVTNHNFQQASVFVQDPIEKREYDYGTGAAGALLRKTDYAYLHNGNSTYTGLNILYAATSRKTYDGAGTLRAQTLYTYDPSSLTSTNNSAPNHDYTNFPSTYLTRGNLWKTQQGLLVSGTWTYLNTTNAYDDLGNVRSIQDPAGHTMTLDYTDSWKSSGCSISAPNTYAYMTTKTDPSGHQTKHNYFYCTGLVGATQDANDIANSRAGTTYGYDSLNRLLTTYFPDGGNITNVYTDTAPLSVQSSQLVTGTTNIVKTTVKDPLGRVLQTQLQDPDCSGGPVKVDYGYGFNSTSNLRYTTVSNPYCTGSETTAGTTTTNYDVLDRVTSVQQADGSSVTTTYAGNVATVTDEALKQRKSQVDGLGRLTYVWEDPSGLNYLTQYQYDTLDNLTNVTQAGGRQRSFNYDSLSRLKCAANPEVTSSVNTPASCPATDPGTYTPGTIYYTYDNDGNVLTKTAPAPNQTGTSSTAVTTYTYDSDSRLTAKSYAGGAATATVKYGYDNVSLTGCTTTPPPITPADVNPIGNRTAMCDGSGATSWSHDPMDRILRAKQTLVGSSNSTQVFVYTHNDDGSLASLQYPSGRTITNTTSAAGRATSAVDTANSINYVTQAHYAPPGEIGSFTYYATISAAFSYNSRLQPLQIFYGTNSVPPLTGTTCPTGYGNIMHRAYHFGAGSNDNGNVQQIDNCRDTNRTVLYTYDSLNHIESAATQGTTNCNPAVECWGQLFGHMQNGVYVSGYDAWGNLHEITATNGAPTMLSQTMTSNNQFLGMTYDAAGNLINDGGGHTYTFDDENRLTAIPGWTYAYDGDGMRVEKCSSCSSSSGGTLYWHGAGNDSLVESNLAGTLTNEYVFFNGRRIARRDNTNNPPTFYFSDHLGSTSGTLGSGGTIKNESDYYPFGGEVVISNTLPQNYKFTGKERDSESGLDEFGARYYSSPLGRFMTPDWAATATAVPYANFGNPQSLNLYSYVKNNPTTFGDPDGHCCDWQYIAGAVQAYASDNLAAGAFHGNSDNPSFQAGQIAGDKAALAQGIGEAAAGQAGVGGGTVMTLSVVGAPEGLVTVTGSAALEAHGAVTATAAGVHLMAEGAGPKAANAAGVSSSGQATDEHGNKLGGSGKPQQHDTSSNTREAAGNKALDEGSTAVNHSNPKQGDPHFHAGDAEGNKKPNSTHHKYPD